MPSLTQHNNNTTMSQQHNNESNRQSNPYEEKGGGCWLHPAHFPSENEQEGECTFQLQTDAGKCIKGACFSPQKEKELRKLSESKSPSRLSGIVRDEKSGEILVNDATSFSEVAFPYKEMESLVPMPKKCVQSDVSASKEQVGTTELICVTGDLFYF